MGQFNPPPQYRTVTVTLAEILTPAQLEEVEDYVATHGDPRAIEYTAGLKKLLAPYADELLKKGFVADYLAYVITYMVMEGAK